jgi:hypothetical protein
VVNADLLAVFAGVVNGSLVAELVAYEKGVSMLRGGLISVRGLKLTIKEAVIAGNFQRFAHLIRRISCSRQ